MKKILVICQLVFLMTLFPGCGNNKDSSNLDADGSIDSDAGIDDTAALDSGTDTEIDTVSDTGIDTSSSHVKLPELWYSADEFLVRISLSEDDGAPVDLVASPITGLPLGQNCITMLDDGSLVGARLSDVDKLTYFYHIENPPTDGSPAAYTDLGIMPDEIMLEGLYTDCDGRLYGMDTGQDVGSSIGNRLLRFNGSYLEGDFTYEVISDLSSAVVADIDDMGPGIDGEGNISDNPGLAIDTGNIFDFDYVSGTGTSVAHGGTWGIHALGGTLFKDGVSRIYLLSQNADLFELNPNTYEVSEVLITGPATVNGANGWSGLAGPLTDCESGFPPVI